MPPQPSDEFVQLFTREQRGLYLYILAQTGNVAAAEDVLQETNLVIWSKVEHFTPNTNFTAWTRQIATYEILKSRQRRRRDRLTFSDEFLSVVAEEVEAQSLNGELRRDALQHCLGKLNATDKELIERRYQPGNRGRELASELNRPANSVYQSLGRIRRSLFDCIQRQLAAAEVGT